MIKSELVQKIADGNTHLYHRDVERIVNKILDEIIRAMKDGERVELRGFGAFSVKARAPAPAATRAPAVRLKSHPSACPFSRPEKNCGRG